MNAPHAPFARCPPRGLSGFGRPGTVACPPTLPSLAAPSGALSGFGRPGAVACPPHAPFGRCPLGGLSGFGRPGATDMKRSSDPARQPLADPIPSPPPLEGEEERGFAPAVSSCPTGVSASYRHLPLQREGRDGDGEETSVRWRAAQWTTRMKRSSDPARQPPAVPIPSLPPLEGEEERGFAPALSSCPSGVSASDRHLPLQGEGRDGDGGETSVRWRAAQWTTDLRVRGIKRAPTSLPEDAPPLDARFMRRGSRQARWSH